MNIISSRHVIAILIAVVLPVPHRLSAAEIAPGELIEAAVTGENYPVLPSLSTEMRGLAANEIAASRHVRQAYEKLVSAHRNDVASPGATAEAAVAEMEKQDALWCLISCLCCPNEDVQIHAMRSLERLGDKRAVPFLLIYADYMAVTEGGSENATIHGIIHETVAKALSGLTGIKVALNGQNPEGLKQGIRKWRRWEIEQHN